MSVFDSQYDVFNDIKPPVIISTAYEVGLIPRYTDGLQQWELHILKILEWVYKSGRYNIVKDEYIVIGEEVKHHLIAIRKDE